jgi:hypothetical protein
LDRFHIAKRFQNVRGADEEAYPSSVTPEKENFTKTWKRSSAMAFSPYFLTAYLIRRVCAQTLTQ